MTISSERIGRDKVTKQFYMFSEFKKVKAYLKNSRSEGQIWPTTAFYVVCESFKYVLIYIF